MGKPLNPVCDTDLDHPPPISHHTHPLRFAPLLAYPACGLCWLCSNCTLRIRTLDTATSGPALLVHSPAIVALSRRALLVSFNVSQGLVYFHRRSKR
jgi:hypothetical protein